MNNNLKVGFTLIEMMIVLMLSAIIVGIMLSSYSQLQRMTRTFDSRVDLEASILSIASLFERDVSSACIPLQAYQAEKERRAEVVREKRESTQPKILQRPAVQQQNGAQEGSAKTPDIKAIFFAQSEDDDNTTLFTFITNNPLEVYWSEGAGYPKPRIARVVYRLKKNTGLSTYSLWRQEGFDLDYSNYTKADSNYRQYLISDIISQFELTFFSYEANKEGEAQEEVSELEYGDDEEILLDVPQLIMLNLTVYDQKPKRSQPFSVTYRIWAQAVEIPEVKEESPVQEEKKEVPKPVQTADKNKDVKKNELPKNP